METIVKVRIIKIGNSQGIRIPKPWLDQLNFGDELEMVVQPDQLVIRSPQHARQNWGRQFAAMAHNHDDVLLDTDTATRWERDEWDW